MPDVTTLIRTAHRCLLVAVALLASGCAMVKVSSVASADYVAQRRGDILTSKHLSGATAEALRTAGLSVRPCEREALPCIDALTRVTPMDEERRQSALAELWLVRARAVTGKALPKGQLRPDALGAYLEAARHAYAYLFFSERSSSERSFEDRQTQVRDYYNYSVQQLTIGVTRIPDVPHANPQEPSFVTIGDTTVHEDVSALSWANAQPRDVVPASALRFVGIRSVYRRDGLGAELVADLGDTTTKAPFSAMPTPSATAFLRFEGDTLDAVLTSKQATLAGYDPYRQSTVQVGATTVPLAANFTAGYGLWLAHSGFATQSLRSLFGRMQGIDKPHVYLMQPYDPDRRVILLLHGLASSPEAWVNVANEILGDERLRRHYQVWQVYYPTNMPIPLNHREIRKAFLETLRYFDPDGKAAASRDMVIVGHSMGGVIARLMVSSSGDAVWNGIVEGDDKRRQRMEKHADKLKPYLQFQPMPQFSEAIFIAAPHRGTEFAGNKLGRLIANLIRLPPAVLTSLGGMLADINGVGKDAPKEGIRLVPNSIDNLSADDAFIRAAANLPISPAVRYHSIIARRSAEGPMDASDDGLVPYWSSHLDAAASEKVIVSGHSVQETPAAVLEIRRILDESIDHEPVTPSPAAH